MAAIQLIIMMEGCFVSTIVCDGLVDHLMGELWRGVAAINVARMAPGLTRDNTMWAVDTLSKLAFTEEYRYHGAFVLEKDPVPAVMDTLAPGTMGSEEARLGQHARQITQTDKSQEVSKHHVTGRSKKTIHSSKITEPAIEKNPIAVQSFLISLKPSEEQPNQSEQNLRKIESDRLTNDLKMKKTLDERVKQRQKTAVQNQKFLKDKKPFTFDYEGGYSGVNPLKLPGETVRKMKEQYSQPSILVQNKAVPESKSINNDRLRETKNAKFINSDKPLFSGKSFSIAEALDDPSKVSEGVKITEIRGNNNAVIRQGKAKKLQGILAYRLKQFQTISKDNNYRQFPRSSDKKMSTLNVNATEPEDKQDVPAKVQKVSRVVSRSSKKSESESKISDKRLTKEALGRGLPFIRTKGLRFNDLGSTMKSFQLNIANDPKKSRRHSSKIHIKDTQLYEQTFFC